MANPSVWLRMIDIRNAFEGQWTLMRRTEAVQTSAE